MDSLRYSQEKSHRWRPWPKVSLRSLKMGVSDSIAICSSQSWRSLREIMVGATKIAEQVQYLTKRSKSPALYKRLQRKMQRRGKNIKVLIFHTCQRDSRRTPNLSVRKPCGPIPGHLSQKPQWHEILLVLSKMYCISALVLLINNRLAIVDTFHSSSNWMAAVRTTSQIRYTCRAWPAQEAKQGPQSSSLSSMLKTPVHSSSYKGHSLSWISAIRVAKKWSKMVKGTISWSRWAKGIRNSFMATKIREVSLCWWWLMPLNYSRLSISRDNLLVQSLPTWMERKM